MIENNMQVKEQSRSKMVQALVIAQTQKKAGSMQNLI
jgi:hypothetical protein